MEPILAHSRRAIAEVTIDVDPADARATLDGQPIAGGATRALRVDPGTHALRVEAEDRIAILREVALEPGARIREVVALVPVEVAPLLEVRSSAGARIEIDGAMAGTTAVALTLEPGAHEVYATLEGHGPLSRTLTLAAGERVVLDAGLARLPDEWWRSPWPWLAIGALAAGAGVGAAFGIDAAAHAGAAPSGGTTSIVLIDLEGAGP